MGKLNIFQLTLSNFQRVYYAGQNVEGYLTVELTEEMSYRGIRLEFKGKAKVSWEEEHTSSSGKSKTKKYKDKELYFSQDVLLSGALPDQGNNKSTLGMGRHTFPFSFPLPDSLPSSFEGKYGYVRYSVMGIIDKPWKLLDDQCKKFFTVIRNLDLNENPVAATVQSPQQGRDDKMICCCCCASGPIVAEFRLERTGYVPGEPIPLGVAIYNNSRRAIAESYVSLIAVTTFHSTKKDRTSTKEVCRMKPQDCTVAAGQNKFWEAQQFVPPPMPPSYLQGCNIIDTRYILQLNVEPSGLAMSLEVGFDIVLGTLPLRQFVEAFPPRPAAAMPPPQAGYPAPGTMYPPIEGASAPNPPVDTPAPLATTMPVITPPSGIPNLPPPLYKKCPFNKDDDNESLQYEFYCIPFYPIYDWGYEPSNDK